MPDRTEGESREKNQGEHEVDLSHTGGFRSTWKDENRMDVVEPEGAAELCDEGMDTTAMR